jgi:beta-mannosidase
MQPDWQLGHAATRDAVPERWIPAAVPGAVQLDWARAENWPPFWFGQESDRYRWMEDVWWTYRARFTVPEPEAGGVVRFECGGADYRFAVLLDGQVVHEQEGMYSPFAVDLTAYAGRKMELFVRVEPAPKSRPAPEDRAQANRVFKPAVSYGWDFHPRLIPLGMWQPAVIVVLPALRLENAEVTYRLNDDCTVAALDLCCTVVPQSAARLRWRLLAPDGDRVVLERELALTGVDVSCQAEFPEPELWWPHDHGPQPRYTHVVQLLDATRRICAERRWRTGFRRARLVQYPGQWNTPPGSLFPKPRTEPPITLEINGRSIFAKGSNWVAPDIFPGTLDAGRLEPLLRLARATHFNLLRCWGGAAVMSEAFFELADELGLMIWQEFTLACNRYPDDPDYLAVANRESRSILRRVRPHPCVVLWCGGNELFNNWSGMDDQSLALRLLDRNCLELDPATPFLPTSPVGGMAHGHYVFWDKETSREVWTLFQEANATAYTEFGVPGAANAEVLRRILPPAELWPPQAEGSWKHHHAFSSWTEGHHLCLEILERYFGPIGSLERLVELSQWTQGEGLRGIYEESRRQKPRASMALNWCFTEPWPAAANLSLLCWPGEPKASLATVAAACRPVLAGARLSRFQWAPGDSFEPELWLLNDRHEPLPPLGVEAVLEAGALRLPLLTWQSPAAPENTNLRGPRACLILPDLGTERFVLHVTVNGHPKWDSHYTLSFRRLEKTVESRPMNLG